MTDQERAKVITDDFSFWGPAQGDFHSERARCTQLITAALAAVRAEEREACAKVEFARKALNEIWNEAMPSRKGHYKRGAVFNILNTAAQAVGRLDYWDHVLEPQSARSEAK